MAEDLSLTLHTSNTKRNIQPEAQIARDQQLKSHEESDDEDIDEKYTKKERRTVQKMISIVRKADVNLARKKLQKVMKPPYLKFKDPTVY